MLLRSLPGVRRIIDNGAWKTACCRIRPGADLSDMLTVEEKTTILKNAYIPEHSVDLISGISGGEPFLVDGCLALWKKGELILIGYPLTGAFDAKKFETTTRRLQRRFRPARISYIAPQAPLWPDAEAGETACDDYFTLDLQRVPMAAAVKRNIRNASRRLTVEKSGRMDASHRQLVDEFIARVKPGDRVQRLFERMPAYVAGQSGGYVLNARDGRSRLNAFYVVDLAPADFSTYVIGCYGKKNYIAGASDLLMSALVDVSRQSGKTFIHLGLGVNEGLRRFKRKWGGVPSRPYRMGTVDLKTPRIWSGIREFLKQH